jgi:hypothetical protein
MIYKTRSPIPNHVRISFELPSCLWADRIYVVGDFNQWKISHTPMSQDRDGVWRAVVDLPSGTHAEFRYLIDGQWKTDYHADGFVTNNMGAENSVVYANLPEIVPSAEQLNLRRGNRTAPQAGATGKAPRLPPLARKGERVPQRMTSSQLTPA